MKKIVNFAITYPVTILMVVLATLLLGKISYDRLGVDLFPSMDSPKLYIELTTTEMPPSEIEAQIVEDIEATAIRTKGAKSVTSYIRSNEAMIVVEYTWGQDMEESYLELQQSMTSYSRSDDIEEITVTENDPSDTPIIQLALSHPELSVVELTKIANSYVKPQLLSVEGVADVEFNGDLEQEVVVATTPYKLEAFSLTTSDLSTKIQENNYRVAGGNIEDNGTRYTVNGSNVLESIEEFNSIIVAYEDGKAVYLLDVAEVYMADKTPESIVRLNGEECVGIEIHKERDFNTLKACQAVLQEVASLQRTMAQYNIVVVSNQGEFIERSIGDVKSSAVLGMLLAIVVLFIFLRRIGTTIIISLAIPISIVATFNMFYFGGLTLNIMTLGGLALGAGMLVDNAIVVIENIFRKQEDGASLSDAIVDGTSQVGGAIIASTLTTIVVFFPIVYLHGQSGELFKEQAWSVTFALVSSLFVAIIAIPVMYSKFVTSRKKKEGDKEAKASVSSISSGESIKFTWYGTMLKGIVNNRYWVILGAIAYIGAIVLLSKQLGSEFMPSSGSKSISMELELDGGTTLARTRSTVQNIENVIEQITGEDVTIYSRCGVENENGGSTPLSNKAEIDVMLGDQTLATAPELIEQLEEYLDSISGLKVTYSSTEDAVSSLFDQAGGDIVIEIKGEDSSILSTLQSQVLTNIEHLEGIESVSFQESNGEQELTIFVDRVVASINDITLQSVVSQVEEQLDGADAGEMEYQGDMRDITVRVPQIDVSQIGNLQISQGEQSLLLKDIATISISQAPSEITRIGQSRVLQISLMCSSDVALSKLADNVREQIAAITTPEDYYISIEGSERERKESFTSLLFAMILSVALVYMVMASQFESLLHPFTILLTIPLAVAGAVLLFIITGVNLNIMAAIGIIMLVGIAVNSSILLVDRIGQLRSEGYPLYDAIIASAEQRIRPILMTSITTILALMPMALSSADGAEFQRPMAIAVIGGLVASTILSLTVIPCLYYALEEFKSLFVRAKKEE
ncbi:MAG: efflux RND transporter permease subunit [Rikenellaceae bacterium]